MKKLSLVLFLFVSTILFSQNLDSEVREQKEEGRVCWIKNTNNTNTKPYILYDGVPEGTIVLVENPMMERKMYAKVIGKLPKTNFTSGTIAMLSPSLAQSLGILDSYSFLIIKYLTTNLATIEE